VLVVAPVYEGAPQSEPDVVRIPAIQNFNGSDFSLALPVPGYLTSYFDECRPDIVHSHHPHLLGNTAVRIASRFSRPLVFTHHTMYEQYLHYVPAEAGRMRGFVISLVTGYCNLCDCIIAPSQSVAQILRDRGVDTPIEIIPTGVDVPRYEKGDAATFRCSHGISRKAFVAGYVGRLAPEKNLSFLAEAMRAFVSQTRNSHFLVVGSGPSSQEIRKVFREAGLRRRLHLVGSLEGQDLVDAYHAMDVFVFASHSETQGMVLTEAMAAGRPVVALDAPGVREVVENGYNGRLLDSDSPEEFAAAIGEIASASSQQRERLGRAAVETAREFSMDRCARDLMAVYERLVGQQTPTAKDESAWRQTMEEVKGEWELIRNMAGAVGHAITS
jgi:glycosyltransferase involved in cell wall biosynthesis